MGSPLPGLGLPNARPFVSLEFVSLRSQLSEIPLTTIGRPMHNKSS